MAEKASEILPLIVGAKIPSSNEEYSLYRVNCEANNSTETSKSGDLQVLHPCNDDNYLPLSGGAVAAIPSPLGVFTSDGIPDSLKSNNLQRYGSTISAVKSLFLDDPIMEAAATDGSNINFSKLIERVRKASTRALKGMPSDLPWGVGGPPELYLAGHTPTDRRDSVLDYESLKANLGSDQPISGKEIGKFKFIPIEALASLIMVLSGKDEASEAGPDDRSGKGLYNAVGPSGRTMGELAESLWQKASASSPIETADDIAVTDIMNAVLDLFPIFRVSEDDINAPNPERIVGYYTAYNNTLYAKFPELSGTDSSGSSPNMHEIGEEDSETPGPLFFLRVFYGSSSIQESIAINHLPPPSLGLNSESADYPVHGNLEITLDAEGLNPDMLHKYNFFLSPLMTRPDDLPLSSQGMELSPGEIEVVTSPVLTRATTGAPTIGGFVLNPWFTPARTLNSSGNFNISTTLEDQTSITLTGAAEHSISLSVGDVGIPNVNLPTFVGSVDLLVGEKNRSDGFLGDSSDNDDIYFNNNSSHLKRMLSSTRPKFFNINLVSSLWAKNLSPATSGKEDGEPVVRVTFDGLDIRKKFRPPADNIKFAVYVMDEIGQIARATNSVLQLSLPSPSLGRVTPGGFQGDLPMYGSERAIVTISGSDFDEVVGVRFSPANSLDPSLATDHYFSDGVFRGIVSENSIGIMGVDDSADYGTLTGLGSNVGPVTLGLIDRVGGIHYGAGRTGLAYISPGGTPSADRPSRDEVPPPLVLIEHPEEEFEAAKFFENSFSAVPLLMDGGSAKLKIKSNNKLFRSGNKLFGYLALKSTEKNRKIIKDFSMPSEVVSLRAGDGENYIVAINVIYRFSDSNSGDFYRLSNKNSILKFPGSSYVGYNFSQLPSADGPSKILITNKEIELAAPADNDGAAAGDPDPLEVTLEPNGYGTVDIDGFSHPPTIRGLYLKLPGSDDVQTNARESDINGKLKKKLEKRNLEPSEYGKKLKAGNKVSLLGVHVDLPAGAGKYKGYIGGKRLSRKLGFESLTGRRVKFGGGALFVFKGKQIDDDGWLDVEIRKKDKNYGVTYGSSVYNRVTVSIEGDEPFETVDGVKIYNGSDLKVLKGESDINQGSPSQVVGEPVDSSSVIIPTERLILAPSSYPRPGGSASDVEFMSEVVLVPNIGLKLGREAGTGDNKIIHGTRFEGIPDELIVNLSPGGYISQVINSDILGEIGAALGAESENKVGGIPPDLCSEISRSQAQSEPDPTGSGEVGAASDSGSAGGGASGSEEEGGSGTAAGASDQAAALAQVEDQVAAAEPSDTGLLDGAVNAVVEGAEALDDASKAANEFVDDVNNLTNVLTDDLSSAADFVENFLNDFAGSIEGLLNSMIGSSAKLVGTDLEGIIIPSGAEVSGAQIHNKEGSRDYKLVLEMEIRNASSIRFNIPEIVEVKKEGDENIYLPNQSESVTAGTFPISKLSIRTGEKLRIKSIGVTETTKFEISGIRANRAGAISFLGPTQLTTIIVPDMSLSPTFSMDGCVTFGLTNSNENMMRGILQLGTEKTFSLEDDFGDMLERMGLDDIKDRIEMFQLRIGAWIGDKSMAAKEFLNSFCDLSFHLTAELKYHLDDLKTLYIPIKVILCIIDVICALMNPFKLAYAIIRLFACLFELLLLLPQIAIPIAVLFLLLHLLELLQCVILKILGWIVAINDIITSLDAAITYKNYAAIVTLEETLNEHIFSLETDLEVLEPIITILGMILEIIQMFFRFPCEIEEDGDPEMCISPSMLAGIILSKVMSPTGEITPDALLPMAQSYTALPKSNVGGYGNTPEAGYDSEIENKDGGTSGVPGNVLVRPGEAGVGDLVANYEEVMDTEGELFSVHFGEEEIDADGNPGRYANVKPSSVRFDNGDFEATFGLSFTKSTKGGFKIFKGPDPRVVTFEFEESGITSWAAYHWFLGIFVKAKTLDELQTLDDGPVFLKKDGDGNLRLSEGTDGGWDLVSPRDGYNNYLKGAGSLQPRGLTLDLISYSQEVDDKGFPLEDLTETPYQKTFPGIPMVALVDDEFNVYFIEPNGINTVGNKITSITAKMINHPSAPKQKASKDDFTVYRTTEEEGGGGTKNGEKIVQQQANANWILANYEAASDPGGWNTVPWGPDGDPGSGYFAKIPASSYNATFGAGATDHDEFTPPFPDEGQPSPPGAYNYLHTDDDHSPDDDQQAISEAIDTIKVLDFPRLYVVDLRHCADEIASACQVSDMNEALFDLGPMDAIWPDDFGSIVGEANDCIESFRDYIKEKSKNILTAASDKTQSIEDFQIKLRETKFDVEEVYDEHKKLELCIDDAVTRVCPWVFNPLNTGFKIINEELADSGDELGEDPTRLDPDIIDGVSFDLPTVTGASEFASGIGDMIMIEAGSPVYIEIVPRDSKDADFPISRDWSSHVELNIVKDKTESRAYFMEINEDGNIISRESEKYFASITSQTPGVVQISASFCDIPIRAWADKGLIFPESAEDLGVDCIPDAEEAQELFSPGSIMQVDRILTIIFTPKVKSGINFENDARDASAESAKPSPQGFGTKLEN